MYSSYVGKGIRLNDLLVEADRFFTGKGFLISSRRDDSEIHISVKTGESAITKIVDVRLCSDPKGSLSVVFLGLKGSSVYKSALLSYLGGGFLTLKRQKLDELLDQLEKEFWEMVDKFMVSA